MIWRLGALLCAAACSPYLYAVALTVREMADGLVVPAWAIAFVGGGAGGWSIAAVMLWDRAHWRRG